MFYGNNGNFKDLVKGTHDSDSNDTYEVNMTGESNWSGNISNLIFQFSDAGNNVSIDFISIRKSGFESSLDTSTLATATVSAAGDLIVNTPPLIQINQPDIHGGVAIRPWNMDKTSDLVIFDNLKDGADPGFSSSTGENYTTFIARCKNRRWKTWQLL